MFEAIDQFLYCIFVYFMALALMKPLVWPTLRFDTYVYFITTIPAALNAVIRFTFIFIKVSFNDESTISIVTSVMSSFLIYLVPLTFVIISTVTNSRCGVTCYAVLVKILCWLFIWKLDRIYFDNNWEIYSAFIFLVAAILQLFPHRHI